MLPSATSGGSEPPPYTPAGISIRKAEYGFPKGNIEIPNGIFIDPIAKRPLTRRSAAFVIGNISP